MLLSLSLSPSHCSLKPRCFSSSKVTPWPGLRAWRDSPLNENRKWGPHGPEPEPEFSDSPFGQASSLAEFGSIVLSTSDPLAKSHLSHVAFSLWRRHNLPLGLSEPPSRPARPQNPQFVRPLFRPPPACFKVSIGELAYLMTLCHHLKPHYGNLAFFTLFGATSITITTQPFGL